jgi:hypothetical protein
LTAPRLVPDNSPAAARNRTGETEAARDVPGPEKRRKRPRRSPRATDKGVHVADAKETGVNGVPHEAIRATDLGKEPAELSSPEHGAVSAVAEAT